MYRISSYIVCLSSYSIWYMCVRSSSSLSRGRVLGYHQKHRSLPTRRFGAAGEPAVDLLQRLLAFDPARRCGAEEALAHEYLSDMRVVAGQSEQVQVAEAIETRSSSAQATPFADEGADVDMTDMEAERSRSGGGHRDSCLGSPTPSHIAPHKSTTPGKPPLHPPGHGQGMQAGCAHAQLQPPTSGLARHYSDEKDPAMYG